jgi:hypothetical protein
MDIEKLNLRRDSLDEKNAPLDRNSERAFDDRWVRALVRVICHRVY